MPAAPRRDALFVVAGVQVLGRDRAGRLALAELLAQGPDLGDRAPQEIDLGRDKLLRTLAEAALGAEAPDQRPSRRLSQSIA